MLQYFSKLKKPKATASMSQASATSSLHEESQGATIAAATVSLPPPTITPVIPETNALFIEAYDCAKNNHNWNKVTTVISSHPEWLTKIPQGRRWTMLHQIVYCGNIGHLNEVLAFQISNGEFRFLCKALDDKTVREVATERAHVHPQMLRRVERLVAVDQLLHNAKDGKWELVRQFLRQQPDIVNEKPPYRKYYLAHYLASTGQLDMFKDLSSICEFKFDLKVDNKTINQIARENNHIEFAEHIENLSPNINEINENTTNNNDETSTGNTDQHSPSSSSSNQHFFSQGFYDDPGIMIFSLSPNSLGNLFLSQDETFHPNTHDLHIAAQNLFHGQNSTSTTNENHQQENNDNNNNNKKKTKAHALPSLTEEQQVEYEQTVMENIKKFSADNLLNAVTCSITKAILRDPVVAADGFTYEREAILNWFQHSNRSPMTNQELQNQELKPNHAIKSILQSLAETHKHDTKSNDKSKINGDDTK